MECRLVVLPPDAKEEDYAWRWVERGSDVIACNPRRCVVTPATRIVKTKIEVTRRSGYVVVRYRDDVLVYPQEVYDKLYDVFSRFAENREPYPRGVLVLGPPGTGKSKLVEILGVLNAVEVDKITVDRVLSKYVGESEQNLRNLLEREDVVVFLDDFEWLARPRSLAEQQGPESVLTQEIKQLQNIMFDVLQRAHDEKWHVLYVAATNARVTMIDRALRRAGRFDIEVYIPPLDYVGLRILCEELGLDNCEERARRVASMSLATSDAKEALLGNEVKRSRGLGYRVYYSLCPGRLAGYIDRELAGVTRLYLSGPDYLALPLAAAVAACNRRRLIVLTDVRRFDDVILEAEYTGSWLAIPSTIPYEYQLKLTEEVETTIVFYGPQPPQVAARYVNAEMVMSSLTCEDAVKIINAYYGSTRDPREVCRVKDAKDYAEELAVKRKFG